jgi:hypothetical protein
MLSKSVGEFIFGRSLSKDSLRAGSLLSKPEALNSTLELLKQKKFKAGYNDWLLGRQRAMVQGQPGKKFTRPF